MAAARRPSPHNSLWTVGTKSSEIPHTRTQSWTASFTMLTESNSPAKACDGPEANRTRRVDHTASLMPEIHRPEARYPGDRNGGRHHPGIPGGIIPLYPGGFVGIRTPVPRMVAPYAAIILSQRRQEHRHLHTGYQSDRERVCYRAASDNLIEGLSLKQDRARDGLQAHRGRAEKLAPARWSQPVAKADRRCDVGRRKRGRRAIRRTSSPSRREIHQAVNKVRR